MTLADIAEALDTAPRWPVPGTDAQVVVLSLREAREIATMLREASLQEPAPTFLNRQQLIDKHPFLSTDKMKGYISRQDSNGLAASGALIVDDTKATERPTYLFHEQRFLAWLDTRRVQKCPVGDNVRGTDSPARHRVPPSGSRVRRDFKAVR